eukprot:758814-Hanusia_phi.AAC.4
MLGERKFTASKEASRYGEVVIGWDMVSKYDNPLLEPDLLFVIAIGAGIPLSPVHVRLEEQRMRTRILEWKRLLTAQDKSASSLERRDGTVSVSACSTGYYLQMGVIVRGLLNE